MDVSLVEVCFSALRKRKVWRGEVEYDGRTDPVKEVLRCWTVGDIGFDVARLVVCISTDIAVNDVHLAAIWVLYELADESVSEETTSARYENCTEERV